MVLFVTPTRNSYGWKDKYGVLMHHYGVLLSGITVYKVGSVWYLAPENYEEEILINASIVYRGGREYDVTEEEYEDVTAFLESIGYPYDDLIPSGTYPSLTTFPSLSLFPSEAA